MENSANNQSVSIEKLDEIFKKIINDFSDMIISSAGTSVNSILELSSNFIDKKAQQALKDFRGLYFYNKVIAEESVAINKNVDDIFDQLQEKMSKGEEVDYEETNTESNAALSQNRMALSGLQKQLEQIISLDENIKNKLVPVLSSMQFEDMIRQRIEHIRDGWSKVLLNQNLSESEFQKVLEEIGESLTSGSERESYYPRLLGREAPKGIEEQQSLEDILF